MVTEKLILSNNFKFEKINLNFSKTTEKIYNFTFRMQSDIIFGFFAFFISMPHGSVRGANLEKAEIVVGCRWLTCGICGVEKAGCAGPQNPLRSHF